MPQSEPNQMMVLYSVYPQLDTIRLANDIHAFEPMGPKVDVSAFSTQEGYGKRIDSGVVTVGDLFVSVLLHNEPLDREIMRFTVGASNLTDENKSPMRMHQAYALLSLTGNAQPTHRMATLLKVAGALVQQGGVGIANIETWSAYVPQITNFMRQPDFWPAFYSKGIPAILAVGFVKVHRGDELWFLTKGHQLYGLPNLAYQANGHDEASMMFDLFSNIFHYMMDVGPVIEAGHTMELENGRDMMHFSKPVDDDSFLQNTLVVSMNQ